MAQATHTLLVAIGDNNTNSGNITNSFNSNITVYKSDQDAKILRWLSPLEPNNRHQGVRTDRCEGVGNWLLETSEFKEWRGSEDGADKAVLFCSGDPGVGKTYLSSLVIDSLCDRAGKEGIAVTGLYYDFLAQQEQTITNIMGAILKQLAGGGEIPEYLGEEFQKAKREFGGRRPLLADLMRMLKIAISQLPQVFICIDALDECLPKHLPELLKSLRDIVRESPTTRIFLTGRPHIRGDIQRYFPKATIIPISPNPDDIRDYVEMRLDGDPDPEAMNDDLWADIVRIVLERISDIFLLVSLNMDAILGEVTIRQRKKLEEMTRGNGLSDAYTATLTRLKQQKGNKSILGQKVLMWVAHSERPLRTEELCNALGVEVGSADLDPDNIPAVRTIVASCLGLVTVEASSSTVRLVHFTLQEHLSTDPTLFHSPHSAIAEVCLTYLNFGCIQNLAPTLLSAPSTAPLLEYASLYWGKHTRRGVTENVKILALRLLDRFDEHISAQLLLLHCNQERFLGIEFDEGRGPIGFTGLHGVASLGVVEIVAAVLEMKEWDVNTVDGIGSTALTWAARRGHEEVVKMLLERGDVNPNQADQKCRTPLFWAALDGHEGVVKVLLEREDVNPDRAENEYGGTPLTSAAEYGHDGVVRILLEREDVNPNHVDTGFGKTPLLWAAKYGREGVVGVLLERKDVNPDQADTRYGRTPLGWAAERGHDGIVRILLEQEDVNPNQVDTIYDQSPLGWAARYGHEGVVKILSERDDVNPDQADAKGRTPLLWAAAAGREGVVKILLEREGVNPGQVDSEFGRTPLMWAAWYGHEEVVKDFLERADVNPDQVDTKFGNTPLCWAAAAGHQAVVKILLGRDDVNPNHVDTKYGNTPLSWAARYGHEAVVKMLLEREDVSPNQAGTPYGRVPLSWAAMYEYEAVVKILLGREDINPSHVDTQCGRTPLSWAATAGHEGIVKILLEREDVNPDQADTEYGQTPLSWAAKHGHEAVVKALLEREEVNPDQADTKYGQTPLMWAAKGGHGAVVRMLLEREDVNPDRADTEFGKTPLSFASENGHDVVVRMLLERNNVPTAGPDNTNQTPLSLNPSEAFDGPVRAPLKRDNSDSDTPDRGSQSSSLSSTGGGGQCVEEMQSRDDNPNPINTNLDGQPALLSADPNEPEAELGLKPAIPNSTDSDLSSTEPRRLPQPSSPWSLKFLHPPWKSASHPNNDQLALSSEVNWYFIIASIVCLIAFLVYILPSSFLDISSFHK